MSSSTVAMPEVGMMELDRQSTLIGLFEKNQVIGYDILMKELALDSVRDLEALIIEAIGLNLIKGIIDQEKRCVEVYETVPRDVRREDLPQYMNTIRDWLKKCEHTLQSVEQEIYHANKMAEDSANAQARQQEKIEAAKQSEQASASSIGQYGFDARKRDDKNKRSMTSKYIRGFKTPKPNKKQD